jgi:hypothetical protein
LLFGTDHRKSERFEYKATVMIENEQLGHLNYGQMVNYSADGMCFGSDVFYTKGTTINIRLNGSPYKSAPTNYSGTVRWCKELVRDNFEFSYGVGIEYD